MEAGGVRGGGSTAAPPASVLPFCVVIMMSLPASAGQQPRLGGVFCVLAVGVLLL